ncbi:phosphate ABC transporter substrate-binding protein PstS [Actinomyces culturomici]|uniref:phosphate ABC transporter substrate-binding protein PstS n=1 Tax=Actinomyces culturomici TaxID=1926276 RepID=UPI000E1FCF6B|nr:phosphate ABC transporter substrate-binding protein PstS [Actinomyces culturomici]
MSTRLVRFGALAGAAALMTTLAACGSNGSSDSTESSAAMSSSTESSSSAEALSGNLAGAGASSQEAAMEAWKAGFSAVQPDVAVSYDAVGSGAGITQFNDGQVLWAGSDAPLEGDEMTAAEARCGAPAWDLPVYISPVAVIFNLDGISSLNLTASTIAKIFSGAITNWNDAEIAASNPGVTLPDLAITPVHRSDKSGTTENFTDYLHEAAGDVWTYDAGKEWPIEGGESGDKTAGVVQAVTDGKGAIGYADASQAGSLGTAALAAADGTFVSFSNETAAAAADNATAVEGREANDIALKVNRVPETNNAYPLVLVSYSIVCSTYADANEAALVKAFVGYQVSQEGQQMAADNAGSAPLSADMTAKVQAALDAIK